MSIRQPGRPPGTASPASKTRQKAVRFDDETTAWLEQRALAIGENVSTVVRAAVAAYRREV